MERSDFEKFLKQLENLDKQISDDSDPEPLIDELNKVLNGLSSDLELDISKKTLSATLNFVNTSNNPDPTFNHEGDSGFDIRANLTKDIIINEGSVSIIPTGLYFEVNKGLEVQIRSRSGMVANSGLISLNSPGTVDCVTEDTIIKTPKGDITIKNMFDKNQKDIISFNEEEFNYESDHVIEMWIVNNVECVKISTQNNSVIIPSTKEVYTKRGWIQSKDLLFDDEILIFD